MIFVNFKTYEQSSGQKALSLTRILQEVSSEFQVKIVPVVQTIDAEMVVNSTRLDVWVQHIDPISYGAHTGWTLPEEVRRVGVKGVFLNHSEHKFDEWDALVKAVAKCREVDLKTLVFADGTEELKKVLETRPDYASYEPPELVGSTETSVARSKPEIIEKASKLCKEAGIPLIVGAGVKDKNDVEVSLKLGAEGIAVASAIVKAEDQKKVVSELASGF